MRIEYTTVIKNGNLDREVIDKLFLDLKHFDGKSVIVSVEPIVNHRTERQNKYYFGCVIEEERGCFKERFGELFTKEEIHAFNKAKFFQKEIYDPYINEVMVFPM